MKVTTEIVHDKRYTKKEYLDLGEEKYPVKIRVTYNRKQKYYIIINPETKLSIDVTEADFKKITGERPRVEHKELKIILNGIEETAREVIKSIPVFTFPDFELRFLNRRNDARDAYAAFDKYVLSLTNEGRVGSAVSYKAAKVSLSSFVSKLMFEDVTPDFLKKYEKWMTEKNKSSITTVGIYLRSLKSIINKAIREGTYSPSLYPFGQEEGKYKIPSGKGFKRALELSDIEKIFKSETAAGSSEDKAKDFWIFSYLCNGINMKDILLLKCRDMSHDVITFVRAKTAGTTSEKKSIQIHLTTKAKEIIEKWRSKKLQPDEFLFPILEKGLSPQREYELIQQFTKMVNKYIRVIAKDAKIKFDVTTYSARHSFSTISLRKGASIELIAESLGHTNIKTTQSYLASFGIEAKKKLAESLTEFE